MRALISKVVTGTMIAGAALMISACTKTETTSTNIVDLNATDESTMTDNMTAVDAGNDTGMVANETVVTNTTTTTTTNAM